MYIFLSFWMFSFFTYVVATNIFHYRGILKVNGVVNSIMILICLVTISIALIYSEINQTITQLVFAIIFGLLLGIISKNFLDNINQIQIFIILVSIFLSVATLVGYNIYQSRNIPEGSDDLETSFSQMMKKTKGGVDKSQNYLNSSGKVVPGTIMQNIDIDNDSKNDKKNSNQYLAAWDISNFGNVMYHTENPASPYVRYDMDETCEKMYDHPDNWKYITFYKGDEGYIHRIKIGNRWDNYFVYTTEDDPMILELEKVMNTNYRISDKNNYGLMPATPSDWGDTSSNNSLDNFLKYEEKYMKTNQDFNDIAEKIATNDSTSKESWTYAEFLEFSGQIEEHKKDKKKDKKNYIKAKITSKKARKIAESNIDMTYEKFLQTSYDEDKGEYVVYFKPSNAGNVQQPDSVIVNGKTGKVLSKNIQAESSISSESTTSTNQMTSNEAELLAMDKFNQVEHSISDGFQPRVSHVEDKGDNYVVIISDTPEHIIDFTVDKTNKHVTSGNLMYQ